MIASRRLLVFSVLAAVALLGLPSLQGGLRAEDWLAFETCSRLSLLELWTRPHLDMRLYDYWRPLSDSFTWLLVRGFGAQPALFQLALLALHVAAAALAGRVLRRLLGLSAGAAIATSLLAVAHPWSCAAVTYLDGGTATLVMALLTLLALLALADWREGERGIVPLLLAVFAAGLAYDAAILLPIVLLAVAIVLPRRERGVPWALLLVLPAVLLTRTLAVGAPFDGYRLGTELLPEFPGRLFTCATRLFLPFFAEHGGPRSLLTLGLAAVALAAVIAAIATRAGDPRIALRQGGALLLLTVGLLGFAPDLFTGAPGTAPDELVLAYKTYPAALTAALTVGWLLARASGRRGLGSLLLALPIVVLWGVGGGPLRAEFLRAQEWARAITTGVGERTDATAALALRHVVCEVPVKVETAGRSGARTLQFGLSASQRPPFRTPERFVYPLFRRELDGFAGYLSEPGEQALLASPWLTPLTCRYERAVDGVSGERVVVERVVVEPRPRPLAPPAGPLRLFADLDGGEPIVADLAQAPQVRVAADSSIVLAVSGTPPEGTPRLFVLNRVHPCVSDRIDYAHALPDRAAAPPGIIRVRFGTAWLREIAHRYPDDVVFVVLEMLTPQTMRARGAPEAVVSNVLPIRLKLEGE